MILGLFTYLNAVDQMFISAMCSLFNFNKSFYGVLKVCFFKKKVYYDTVLLC